MPEILKPGFKAFSFPSRLEKQWTFPAEPAEAAVVRGASFT